MCSVVCRIVEKHPWVGGRKEVERVISTLVKDLVFIQK